MSDAGKADTGGGLDRARLRKVARSCIANKVRVLNRSVTAIYDEALRPHGLKVSQMNVLVAVAAMGGARPSDVGRVLSLEKSTLSRNVERMAERGWLAVGEGPDGRSQILGVTPAGRAVLKAIYPAWRRAQSEALKLLGRTNYAAVDRASRALRRRSRRGG